MKKMTAIIFLFTSLMTLSVVCVFPIKAYYQGIITINADGSISPSTAPVKRNGNLYILTDDLIGSLSVISSNILLNGNGHTVEGEVGGISLKNVENVTLKNLIIKSRQFGIDLSECSNITVFNNTIKGTLFLIANEGLGGISVRGGVNNTIVGNTLENNFYGIYLTVTNSTICENTVENNSVAIYLMDSSNNNIYHNSFINNDENVRYRSEISSQLLNNWDGGFSSGGNYWSDYNGPDANNDGIGGSPYMIDYNNQDRFPLMKPWEADVAVQNISVSSPECKTYNDNNLPLTFFTSKPTLKTSYSLDGQDEIEMNGNITIYGLCNGEHNVTVYAWDASGNVEAYETVSFTVVEPDSFLTVLIVAALVFSICVVGAGLLIYHRKHRRRLHKHEQSTAPINACFMCLALIFQHIVRL